MSTNEVQDRVEKNEAVIYGDDRIIRTIIKMRTKIAELNDEYKERLDALEADKKKLEVYLVARLQERGAKQTKTDSGTAFIGERMTATIADADLFRQFCLDQRDLDFFQARVKLEHLREFMDANGGALPPGVSVFREVTLNVRVPTRGVVAMPRSQQLEKELQDKGLGHLRVTERMVEDQIDICQFHHFPGTRTIACCITLRNGFTVVGVASCVHAENFRPDIGERLAREDAVSKVWEFCGYKLRDMLYEAEQYQLSRGKQNADSCG